MSWQHHELTASDIALSPGQQVMVCYSYQISQKAYEFTNIFHWYFYEFLQRQFQIWFCSWKRAKIHDFCNEFMKNSEFRVTTKRHKTYVGLRSRIHILWDLLIIWIISWNSYMNLHMNSVYVNSYLWGFKYEFLYEIQIKTPCILTGHLRPGWWPGSQASSLLVKTLSK